MIKPEIMLRNGTYFNFTIPNYGYYTARDIAHSLSKLCRFNGHCDSFYSVAQHCVIVSRIVPEEYALAGLLHDAAEAFIGDIPTPLKQLLPDYQLIEAKVERAVFERFGLKYPLPDCVKTADIIALATEERDLLHPHEPWPTTAGVTPLRAIIRPVSPEMAAQSFISRYQEITGEYCE